MINSDNSKASLGTQSDIGTGHSALLPNILSDIRVDFGPPEILGRFFLLADYALRETGVALAFGTFSELVETNRANRDTWRPIVPTFDPQNGLLHPNCAFALIGRDRHGKVVTAQAARIFDWSTTNFKIEAESLRLFYADPAQKARADETCTVTASSAQAMSGLVAFSGGAWWHPSVRGRLLGAVLSRVSRAYAYTRWQTDLTMAVMSKGLIEKEFAKKNGYKHAELGFALRNFELGDYDGGMVWITADEIIDDLQLFMAELESSLGTGGRLRSA
jgi:hypothetical protein